MSLENQQVDGATMKALTENIEERLKNVRFVATRGVDAVQALIAEVVTMEVKLDAAMMILEKNGTSFAELQHYMIKAAKVGADNTRKIRKNMQQGLRP